MSTKCGGSIGYSNILAVHGIGSTDSCRLNAVNPILIIQRQRHVTGKVDARHIECGGCSLASNSCHGQSSRIGSNGRNGILQKGYLLNVALVDSIIDIVSHNIEIESATLSETGNGVALAGDTGNDTISGIASLGGLELSCGEVTCINLHIPHVRHTTGSDVHIVAASAIQNECVPSK